MNDAAITGVLEASDSKTERRLLFLDKLIEDSARGVKTMLAAFDDWSRERVGVDGATVVRR